MASTTAAQDQEDLPWNLGVFDAHCHPTDTMASIPDIVNMKATSLTIMSTRAQDQELVANVARQSKWTRTTGDTDKQTSTSDHTGVVPSFGWHPWFSHQLYDDHSSRDSGEDRYILDKDAKVAHYQTVLKPSPQDVEFLARLPDPMSLSNFLAQTKSRLEQHPCALIGEVGLDDSFRLPGAWQPGQEVGRDDSLTPGGREGRRLSPYRVRMKHQRKILSAQLKLAGTMQRAVSVHGVQAHGVLFETLRETWTGHEREVLSKSERKRRGSVRNAHIHEAMQETEEKDKGPYPPRVCLHSYSGSLEMLDQWLHQSIPVDIFFSFSIVINFSTSAVSKTREVIKAVPSNKILIESDLHIAGARMDENLESVAREVCDLKGWTLPEGIRQLRRNWEAFIYGVRL